MQSRKRILVLAKRELLLCCSTLAGLLAKEEGFDVELIEHPGPGSLTSTIYADLVILMTAGATLTAATRWSNSKNDTKLLLVVDAETKLTPRHLTNFHANGAVSICSTYSEVLVAIQTLVVRNLKYLSPLLIGDFAELASSGSWACLSSKELDVALSITNGKRNVEIASEMNISPKTVSSYKVRIYRKLGISNAAQLVKSRFYDNPSAHG